MALMAREPARRNERISSPVGRRRSGRRSSRCRIVLAAVRCTRLLFRARRCWAACLARRGHLPRSRDEDRPKPPLNVDEGCAENRGRTPTPTRDWVDDAYVVIGSAIRSIRPPALQGCGTKTRCVVSPVTHCATRRCPAWRSTASRCRRLRASRATARRTSPRCSTRTSIRNI